MKQYRYLSDTKLAPSLGLYQNLYNFYFDDYNLDKVATLWKTLEQQLHIFRTIWHEEV